MAHNGYIYGLSAFKFNGTALGFISEDSVDWGGDEPSTTKIFAAQKRNTPVLELKESAGTNELSFDLIELKADNLKAVFGGTTANASGTTTWSAPADSALVTGAIEITTEDGTVISAPKASLLAKFSGKLKYNEVLKVHCKVTILGDGQTTPFTVKFKDA